MTSRLKRKLNDLCVDTSSSKANENFCLIGTPLPPLEKSKDTGEFVPLWKQDVRDEQGRRRLHGAFTGGWSAGYFNTVGSKEGWAPSTFVSSRSERAKKRQARPEDFMDEEDLAEIAEGRKLVDENEEMEFGDTEAELRKRVGVSAEDDSMASALATALAPPPQDSVGAKILRKMGWRMGFGVGPRVTWDQHRQQVRAVRVGVTEGQNEGEDEEARKHMYPRRDTPLLLVPRKDNSHGLGYTPGMGLNASLGVTGGKESTKGSRISSGFGLGALNDADEDDLDVYDSSMGPQSSRRVAYDDAGDDDDSIMIGTSRQPRSSGSNKRPQQPSNSQTFRSGRPVLKGFVVSDRPVSEDRWFPLPEVPQGWKPNPRRVWEASKGKEKENVGPAPGREAPKTHAEWKASLLSADERGTMLGEIPLQSKPRSVFDFMSQKDRERLEKVKDSIEHGHVPGYTPDGPPPPPVPQHVPGEIDIPNIHPSVAKAALSGFQPFTSDPVKQARYTAFLTFISSSVEAPDKQLSIGPLRGQTVEEFNKELGDYAKSATVFKPLSAAMASRFKSAAVIEMGPTIIEGLHTPDLSTTPDEEEEEKKEKEKASGDPKVAAARAGMYGPLTRQLLPWQPARLLCKRFGVKMPDVEVGGVDEAMGVKEGEFAAPGSSTASGPAEPRLAITDGTNGATGDADTTVEEPHTGRRNLANIGLGEDEDQGRDTLTYERPPMDVFKAIFASDDEESDDEEEEEDDEKNEDKGKSATPGPVPLPGSTSNGQNEREQKDDSATMFYMPTSNNATSHDTEEVDLATFKPTFVPRAERESHNEKSSKDKEEEKKRERREKKRKERHAKTLVSFDADGEEGLQVVPKKHKSKDKDGERKKKKRKERHTKGGEDEDDNMWVEAPAPEVVQHLDMSKVPREEKGAAEAGSSITPPSGPTTPGEHLNELHPTHKPRKRAIDFM